MSDELGKRVVEERNIPGGDFKTGIHKFEDLNETEKRVQNEIRVEEQKKLEQYQKALEEEKVKRRLDEYNEQSRNEYIQRENYRIFLINQVVEKSNGNYTEKDLINKSNTDLETLLTTLRENQQRGR